MKTLFATVLAVILCQGTVLASTHSHGNDPNILVFGALFIYFFPSLIAILRRHAQSMSIILVNTFLGWTLIGWFSSLVWSVSYSPSK